MFLSTLILSLPLISTCAVLKPSGYYLSDGNDSPIRLHMKISSEPTLQLDIVLRGRFDKGGQYTDHGHTMYNMYDAPFSIDNTNFELFPTGAYPNDVAHKLVTDMQKIFGEDFQLPISGEYDAELDSITVEFGNLTIIAPHKTLREYRQSM